MRKVLIIFVLIQLLSKTAKADYFSIQSDSYLISYDKQALVKINHNMKGYTLDEFVVRPVINDGVTFIKNTEEKWISASDLWENLPKLAEKMELSIYITKPEKLHFLIQNRNTGEIYKTNENTYYPYEILKNTKTVVKKLEITKEVENIDNEIKKETLKDRVLKYLNEIFK